MRQAVRRRQTGCRRGIARRPGPPTTPTPPSTGCCPPCTTAARCIASSSSRAWDLLDLVGREQVRTPCSAKSRRVIASNEPYSAKHFAAVRALLPQALERHRLLDRPKGSKPLEDDRVERLSQTFFTASPLTPPGRPRSAGGRDRSRRHRRGGGAGGQSTGASLQRSAEAAGPDEQADGQASTAIRSASTPATRPTPGGRSPASASLRNAFASILLAAYQVALDRGERGGDFQRRAVPAGRRGEKVTAREAAPLLTGLEGAIREGNQVLASAHAARYTGRVTTPAPCSPCCSVSPSARTCPARREVLPHRLRGEHAVHAQRRAATVT